MTSSLNLTLAVFLFWHSRIYQLPLTQPTTAHFSNDSNTCVASMVLHSPGFLLIWQIEHSHHRWPCLTSLKPFLWCATGFCVGPNSLHPLHKTSLWLGLMSLYLVSMFRRWYSAPSLCPSIKHSICNIFLGNLSVRHPDLDAGKQT